GMTPTKAGEGKTTTLVGLTQGLGAIGKRSVACLREPSLGPVFGIKGGAAGGGLTQVVPMEDLNLHFTGDIHAIGAANNLLAAMLDASILHGNPLKIDALRVGWRRAIDMNDRALRQMTIGQGGRANGYPRETGFDITAASEVMAILAVSRDIHDLRARLGRITVAQSYDGGKPIFAEDLGAAGAMTVLLKDAIKPNLIQTLEGQPCLMHCGPFANIAHGNNSLLADLIGMKLGDYVVTESGFGSDMGAEKFFDIVCRFGGIVPSAAVLVTTVRAIKHHGGVEDDPRVDRSQALAALETGMANVRRHLNNIKQYGVPCVIAVNRRPGDTNEECELVKKMAMDAGAFAAEVNEGFTRGGLGAADLASAVVEACEQPSDFRFLYEDDWTIQDKIETVAKRVYGASDVYFYPEAEAKLGQFTRDGLGHMPICMAKTHLSLSGDATLLNAPDGFTLPVRDIRAYTGAGWLVPLAGDIMQMPGLGKTPAALNVDIDGEGRTVGLF
ncbi:MAG TPA: formate--tetrahydrofolate ligase, partial [Thermoleophilaceae bacterium]